MLEQSFLKSQVFAGPLGGSSALRPTRQKGRRSLLFTLTLTSLIDAFVIMVIYLLVNFGNPAANLKINGDIQLPSSVQTDQLGEGTVVSVKDGRYFIEDKELSLQDITRRLIEVAQSKGVESGLVLQADKKADYAALSPVILAGSQAGFSKFKFAVLQGKEGGK